MSHVFTYIQEKPLSPLPVHGEVSMLAGVHLLPAWEKGGTEL